ncbi:MAG: hypothetical protein JXA57_10935 [Armatimonadetes bacterium]|nr:hypothetical protein [Armatimonadota bacterium]
MRVLLVEPEYRRFSKTRRERVAADTGDPQTSRPFGRDDETLWYPPLGLMKLARFHKERGDEVAFASGSDESLAKPSLFSPNSLWDRVYIATLFTYDFASIVRTIGFYKEIVGGSAGRLFVGGIMASLMPDDLYEETGIYPVVGVLSSPEDIRLDGNENIDLLAPDYDVVDPRVYATNDTYYAYTSRGCVRACPWCGVPRIEPVFQPYIDIKPSVQALRQEYGDKAKLKLMDNNVLASPQLGEIVEDLIELGYGRDQYTDTHPRRARTVDFNQGLDSAFFTEERVKLLARLNVRPVRIAFDRIGERDAYGGALELAYSYGFRDFSNYMLYNFQDSPRDLYDRLMVNVEINERWQAIGDGQGQGSIYSYPMRYAPIDEELGHRANRSRDCVEPAPVNKHDWLRDPQWTRRFIRNVEIMKGAGHGAIPPRPGLARRAVGATFEEFVANLYMPEELLRNRNRHELHVHADEPSRSPGTGLVEGFRAFMLELLTAQDGAFRDFHEAISPNTREPIAKLLARCDDEEIRKWLRLYLRRWVRGKGS